jgi:hypothetical protein
MSEEITCDDCKHKDLLLNAVPCSECIPSEFGVLTSKFEPANKETKKDVNELQVVEVESITKEELYKHIGAIHTANHNILNKLEKQQENIALLHLHKLKDVQEQKQTDKHNQQIIMVYLICMVAILVVYFFLQIKKGGFELFHKQQYV